ncbi:hypothetical protein ASE01_09320 [Nocardioides sp. Root190]|uniref:alpha/beta hydrolase n=1 Tax=Nocardioides sp. Root190 TaxID=1736488 RepID=UPI0006F9DA53|nr:alpha/beta hydrolase [Nocardioides sp. Root190]KRB76959.1 hypothetical protein ASE01_09320 [Nocardioides sp. Root190]
MTVILVPAHVPAFRTLESTPARALTFATDLRAVTVGVKDVQGWAEGIAAPAWQGDTAAAHDHAATRFARRLDNAEAALDRAVTAADRFEARLTILSSLRLRLEEERRAVNGDATTLRADVTASGSAATEAEIAVLQRRGERLMTRATTVIAEIEEWVRRYDDTEADFIAALAGVDTLVEGRLAAEDPGRVDVGPLVERFDSLRGDPERLNAWWLSLTRAQRAALSTEIPHRVGNANGIPARDRDEANRAALTSDLDYWAQRDGDSQLSGEERSAAENAAHIQEQIDEYRAELDPLTGRELLHLLVYAPGSHSGDGAVAIAFGDPDKADHVSVNVPGLTSETSSTDGNLDKTHDLHRAALDEDNGSVSSIYWLDYDAPSGNPIKPWEIPDLGGVALTVKADAGGERFADFIDGLRGSDEGDRAHLTAIGHSYGSTAVGHGLQDGAEVDDAILIGSPGQPESTAASLTDADVWVGSKDHDPVSLLGSGDRGGVGALGHDPAADDFGGVRFETGDGSLRIEDLLGNHTSYFEDESLDNMAHVVADNDHLVTEQPHRGEDGGGHLTLSELLAASTGASVLDGVGTAGEWLWEHSVLGGIL